MNLLKKISSLFIVVSIIISCLIFTASATGAEVLDSKIFYSLPNDEIDVGDSVTVKVGFTAQVPASSVSFYFNYNSEILEFVEGDGSKKEDGVIFVDKSQLNGSKKFNYSFTFKAKKSGSSFTSVKTVFFKGSSDSSSYQQKGAEAGCNMIVNGEQEKSSDTKLKSLKIEGYSISPSFSESKTSYTASVPNDINKIEIKAEASNSKTKIKSITGNNNLKVGENTVTVTLEAEDGSQNKYTIIVTRQKDSEEQEDENLTEIITPSTVLETEIERYRYSIATQIPKEILIKGFEIEENTIKGYTVETAVDAQYNYVIYYLSPIDSNEYIPYLYDTTTDSFKKLDCIIVGDNTYIVSNFPTDISLPDTFYSSNLKIGDKTIACYTDSETDSDDFKYIYCYHNNKYSVYRYDVTENTIQRYPEFGTKSALKSEGNKSFFSRFASLSTNGKIIILALAVVVLGIFALLIMLIVYLIRRSINYNKDIYYDDDDEQDDFQEIDIQTNDE